MGNGIAHVFAQSGFDVVMIDVSQDALDKGRATVAKNIERQVRRRTRFLGAMDGALWRRLGTLSRVSRDRPPALG